MQRAELEANNLHLVVVVGTIFWLIYCEYFVGFSRLLFSSSRRIFIRMRAHTQHPLVYVVNKSDEFLGGTL